MQISYIPFKGFNPDKMVDISRRNLPHWQQGGCTYFVTFRLADSIPKQVIIGWMQEKQRWLKAWNLDGELSEKEYKLRYFNVPIAVRTQFEREQIGKPLMELDRCHGRCVFRNKRYAGILEKALLYFDGDRLQCGDFVVMPNHVHWIVMPLNGCSLIQIIKSVKQFVSRKLTECDDSLAGKLWQREAYDRCIRDRAELNRTREYIKNNPSKAHMKPSAATHYQAGWLDA
ncbi:MAG: hypothetical protein EOL87_14015 [Spartobacteria bacterium]|nr:hypothetical protein [Spartobacteria bacterium]